MGRSLVRAGHSPADADAIARVLAERHAESNRDRMRHVFKDVPTIYGFSGKAPLGTLRGADARPLSRERRCRRGGERPAQRGAAGHVLEGRHGRAPGAHRCGSDRADSGATPASSTTSASRRPRESTSCTTSCAVRPPKCACSSIRIERWSATLDRRRARRPGERGRARRDRDRRRRPRALPRVRARRRRAGGARAHDRARAQARLALGGRRARRSSRA